MITNTLVTPPCLLDANVAIDMLERNYPRDVFVALWQRFEAVLVAQQLLLPKVALDEIHRIRNAERDALYAMCAPIAVDETRPAVQTVFARLSEDVDQRRLSSKLSDNDLLILSCAEVDGVQLLTNDTKMRNACANGLVAAQCITLVDVFRHFGWQF